jgi:pimeloyl-ACP methyl ester carboxylesterase
LTARSVGGNTSAMPTTRVSDIDVYFDRFGDPAHPTVLLVSGLGAQCPSYEEDLCQMVVAAGYQVVRYDNRDVGLSTHLDGAPADAMAAVVAAVAGGTVEAAYTLSDMAADGIGLLDSLGVEAAHVLGASMGGMIAQTMAIEHPGRVRTLTSVYSTTGEPDVGAPDGDVLASLLSIMVPQDTREGRVANSVELARIIGTPHVFDEQRARSQAELLVDRSYDPDGISRQMVAILASGSRAEGLAALEVPTMVLHGDNDPLVNVSGGHRTAELVPGAELRILEGMAHDMPPSYRDRIVGGLLDNAVATDH